jgi:uncharacterized protein with WD repeat
MFLYSLDVQVWPMFKWSHDDKYVARMGEDKIQIYELPTMKLLDKKSFSVPGVRDFAYVVRVAWCRRVEERCLACWPQ